MYEYKEMAKYYDLFYSSKSYEREVSFLESLIKDRKTILDVGCGTGIHIDLLSKKGYLVDGVDLNKEMLDIARKRVNSNLFIGNLLDYDIDKKYDAIISMFAVFNHLKSYDELEQGIIHSYNHLNKNGILIIDLHNGRSSGKKEGFYKDYKRTMAWRFDSQTFKEYTEITYQVDGKTYCDSHEFLIYQIDKIKDILKRNGFNYKLYENYSNRKATEDSKNIEIIIVKEQ